MTVRIVLVDDHRLMREGLRLLLEREPEFRVVGEAADGHTAIELVRRLSPDVVVMDVAMPDLNGIDAARRITYEYETVKVVGLSAHADRRNVMNMLEAGASGYVLKNAAHDELLRAVHAVSEGRTYLSPEVAGPLVERLTHPEAVPDASVYGILGARQREVLQLVAEGKSSAETAKVMHISTKTVETHRRNIAHKLGLHGTAALTRYAIREGLTTLEI